MLAEAKAHSAAVTVDAKRSGWDGMPQSVLLAQVAANASMFDVKFMDSSPMGLVSSISELVDPE